MPDVRPLYAEDVLHYQKRITQFIFESNTMAAFMGSYKMENAEQKWSELWEYLKQGSAIVFGALHNEELVGLIWAYELPFRDDKSRIYVSILHVDSNYRNQKYGEKLLAAVEKEAINRKITSIYLHAEAVNERAVRFYERKGFNKERVQLVKSPRTLELNSNCNEALLLTAQKMKKHIDAVAELLFMNTLAHILTNHYSYKQAYEKTLELIHYIDEGKARVIGYFDKEKLIGLIWTFPYLYKMEKRYYLNAMVVFPEYRHKQIANTIFLETENFVSSEGRALYTHVDVANTGAYKFYLNHGMREESYQLVKSIGSTTAQRQQNN